MLCTKHLGALALLSCVLTAAGPCHGRVVAVVVGVNDYKTRGLPDLLGAVNDARAVAEVLRRRAHVAEADLQLLVSGVSTRELEPTRANIAEAFSRAKARVGAQDTLLFYFAGHGGISLPESGSCLAPADTDNQNPERRAATLISAPLLSEWLGDKPCRAQVVITDCCRVRFGDRGQRGPTQEPNAEEMQREAQRFAVVAAQITGQTPKPPDRAVIYACGIGQSANESKDGEYGIFTSHLLEGLEGKAGTDGRVTVGGLFAYTQQMMKNRAMQTPEFQWRGEARDAVLIEAQAPSARGVMLGDGRSFASISAALVAVQPGDTVRIQPRVYREDIQVPPDVCVEGADRDTSQIHGHVYVCGSGALQGVSVVAPPAFDGDLVTVAGDKAVVRNCTVRGGSYGVWVEAADGVVLERVTCVGAQKVGIGVSVLFLETTITGCRVEGAPTGLESLGGEVNVTDCAFIGNAEQAGSGIAPRMGSAIYATDCECAGYGDYGVLLTDWCRIRGSRLDLHGNRKGNLRLADGTEAVIRNSRMCSSIGGVTASDQTRLTVRDTRFDGCSVGIALRDDAFCMLMDTTIVGGSFGVFATEDGALQSRDGNRFERQGVAAIAMTGTGSLCGFDTVVGDVPLGVFIGRESKMAVYDGVTAEGEVKVLVKDCRGEPPGATPIPTLPDLGTR